jgi:predicted kinase
MHPNMDAVIFIGVQGAGKSTFYRQRFFDTHVRINLDMLRTRHREKRLLQACLEAGQSFVVDNTNPTAADRARYVLPAREGGFRVAAYFFDVDLRDAMRRNQQRPGVKKIPAAGVAGTFRKIQPLALAEGFDQIFTVRVIEEKNEFVVTEGR